MKKNYIKAGAQLVKVKSNIQVIKVSVTDLSIHPTLANIYNYSDEEAIQELGNSLIEVGQLQPITINSSNQVIAGGRRLKAAISAGMEYLNAIVVDDSNSNQALIMVYHNQHRTKSILEKINEAEILLELIGKNQGKRNDLLNEYDKLTEKGSRFAKAARVIGDISESSLRKLMKLVEFEKEAPEYKAFGLIDQMVNKGLSIDRAYAMMDANKELLSAERKIGKITTINKVITLHSVPATVNSVPIRVRKAKIKTLPVAQARSLDFITDDIRLYNQSCIDMSKVTSESVQAVFTSPPYYNLRNYDNGAKELGQEDTVKGYVDNIIHHLREVKRVLKKTGSFFLNIGETYKDRHALLVPTKVLLALCEQEGWSLVNEIIWAKSNPIPQSNDRKLQTSYEKIFHMVLAPDSYYYNEFRVWNDNEMKIVSAPNDRKTKQSGSKETGVTATKPYSKVKDFIDEQKVADIIRGHNASMRQNELKRIDNTVDHPALMPYYLPIIPILTTTKPGDIVLDPFSGSGTTGKVALDLGRKYIGFELKAENFDLSIKDLTNDYAMAA
jgi:DNA modification methylase